MTRLLLPVMSVALLVGALAYGITHLADTLPRMLYPACQYEDSPGPCVWDAQRQGNGLGVSFWRDAQGQDHPLR